MRPIRATVLIAIVLCGLRAAPAGAAPGDVPPRAPVLVNGITALVFPNTTYNVRCIDYGAMFFNTPATMTMFAYSLNDMRGTRLASAITTRDGFNSDYVSVSAGGQNATHIVRRVRDDGTDDTFYRIRVRKLGMLRIGMAAWGDIRSGSGLVTCSMTYLLGGRFAAGQGPMFLRPSAARIAYASDFSGGVGVASGTAATAVAQRVTRKVNGYAFAIFRPGTGASKITDPKSRTRYDGLAGTGSTTIVERSKGTWTYTLDATVATSRSPVLWVMELPA